MSEDIQALKKKVEELEELLREVLRRLPAAPPTQPADRMFPQYEFVQSYELDGSKGV